MKNCKGSAIFLITIPGVLSTILSLFVSKYTGKADKYKQRIPENMAFRGYLWKIIPENLNSVTAS
jgi:hypothetical protein